ncbi:hypothetical protein [Fibrobacter sp. UWP2]|uniref:hypothetical protein n=1 Tax=Fibrobacter sp. UWP2 TaxID=1896216 RepID=UPI000914F3DE|nr:hypothetical protein [Fibrobacter sp. UWP2]SHI93689.1 hypothetical protein SAMN05720471_11159 [Fibrobacter sp. UWP2]
MKKFPTKEATSTKRLSKWSLALATGFSLLISLQACSEINDSWEVKGGGFIKYKINDSEDYTIELGPRDVEIPFIRNSHHYFLVRTRVEESDRGDAFNIMVNRPVLGDNPTVEQYSWFSSEKSDHGIIFTDQSTVHFDEMDSDSTWTANLDLYAQDCRSGFCSDTLPRLHITGRFRYWIPEEDR